MFRRIRRISIIASLFVLFISLPAFAGQSVTIVCEDDFAPYGYQSKSGGAAGFSTDVIIAAYKSVDVDVKFKVMPYARGMSMIAKGAEIGCYNTNNDEVSLREYHFPGEPLFLGEMVIWARADYEGEMTVDKLIASGETVGVTNGYNYDGPGVNFDYNDKIKKDVANTVTLTLRKLVKGRYNFAAAEKRVALLAIARNKAELDGKVKVVGLIAHPGLYLSFSKKHPEGKKFSDLLGQGIKKIKENGEYARIEKKWDGLIRANNLP